MLSALKRFLERNKIIPTYGEDTIFLMTMAVLILLVIDSSAREFFMQVRAYSAKVIAILVLGMAFTIYTALFTYFKNETEKFYMFWFAFLVNVLSAIATIQALNTGTPIYYYMAPAFSLLIAGVMLILWYANLLDTSTIPYKSESYSDIIYGSFVLIALVMVGRYVADLPWYGILSVSIGYATLFNHAVTDYLPKIFSQREDKKDTILALINIVVAKAKEGIQRGDNISAYIVYDDKFIKIEFPKGVDPESFMREQVQLLGTINSPVAVASLGQYNYKRSWFASSYQYSAIIVDIYQGKAETTKGYRFCQLIDTQEDGQIVILRSIMYIGSIK